MAEKQCENRAIDTRRRELSAETFTLAFFSHGRAVREFFRVNGTLHWPAGGWLEVPLGWLSMRDAGYLPRPGVRASEPASLDELVALTKRVYGPGATVTLPPPEARRARGYAPVVFEVAARCLGTRFGDDLGDAVPGGITPGLARVPVVMRLRNPRLAAKTLRHRWRVVALPNDQVALLTQDWREVPVSEQYQPLRARVRYEPAITFTGTGPALLMAEVAMAVACGAKVLRCRTKGHPFLWRERASRRWCEEHQRQADNACRLLRYYAKIGDRAKQRELRARLRTLGYRSERQEGVRSGQR